MIVSISEVEGAARHANEAQVEVKRIPVPYDDGQAHILRQLVCALRETLCLGRSVHNSLMKRVNPTYFC